MSRKHYLKDETPLQFFAAIEIPEGWRLIEKDKFQYAPVPGVWSYGYWYWVDRALKVRLTFITPACRGSLLVVDLSDLKTAFSTPFLNKQGNDFNTELQKWNQQRILKTQEN